MTFDQIYDILRDLAYKGKKLKVTTRCVDYTYKDDKGNYTMETGLDIEIHIPVKDRTTDKEQGLYTHYVFNPAELKLLHPALLIRRVRSMLTYLESHEVEENLIFRDYRVFDPHHEDLVGTDVVKELDQHLQKIEEAKKQIVQKLKEVS